ATTSHRHPAGVRADRLGRPRRPHPDRVHRRRRAADRLGPRLPGLAELQRRQPGAGDADPRPDRVRQPPAHRRRRLPVPPGLRGVVPPPPLPARPDADRRPAAARRPRPGDPRRDDGPVRPRPELGDGPPHALHAAHRGRRGARLARAPRAGEPPAGHRSPGDLGAPRARPVRLHRDLRGHGRHGRRPPRRRGGHGRRGRAARLVRRRHPRMGDQGARAPGRRARLRHPRRVVPAAPARHGRRRAAAAHRRLPAARRAGRGRHRAVPPRAAGRDRLGARRARLPDLDLAAVGGRGRRAARPPRAGSRTARARGGRGGARARRRAL
ncbi:MAG: Heme A synthase, cytochrome oxidase biogenesis protein Cox15-CtaA, partial [uncultured Solirubrobacteraceae bacterium]